MTMIIKEPHLEKRIEIAKEKARKLVTQDIDSEEDLFLVYSIVLSQRYNLPIFHDYFQDRTLDQLALEVYIWREQEKPKTIGEGMTTLDESVLKEAASDDSWQDLQSDEDFLTQATADFDQMKANFAKTFNESFDNPEE